MIAHMLELSVVFTALVAAAQPAQSTRPDFTGTWQTDSAASKALTEANGGVWRVAGARNGGAGAGAANPVEAANEPVFVIAQSDADIVIEQRFDDQVLTRYVYKLDGSVSVNARRLVSRRSTTAWKGNALVTTGTNEIEGGRTRDGRLQPPTIEEFVEIRTLLPDGVMQVERRRTRNNGPEQVTFSVLKRLKQP